MELKMKKVLLLCLTVFSNSDALEFIDSDYRQPIITGLPSIGDLNGDGYNDVFISGFYKQFDCFIDFTGCNKPLFSYPAKVLINDTKGGFVRIKQVNEIEFTSLEIDDFQLYYSIIADVDTDGDNDIVSSDGRVFLNDGTGQFSLPIIAGFTPSVQPVFVADFDNDGVVEILNSGKIFKRVQTQPLEYTEFSDSFSWNPEKNVEIADFDNDGYQDILIYGNNEDIEIFLNNKNGGFIAQNFLNLSIKESLNLTVGDIDNDDDIDIVLSNQRLLKNDMNSGFVLVDGTADYSIVHPIAILLSDEGEEVEDLKNYLPKQLIKYNGDDFLDLLLILDQTQTSDNQRFVRSYVAINDGTGQFGIKYFSLTPNYNGLISQFNPKSTYINADFNSDGYEDFVENNFVPIYGNNLLNGDNNFVQLTNYKNPKIYPDRVNLFVNNKDGVILKSDQSNLQNSQTVLFDYDDDDRKELLFVPRQNYDGFLFSDEKPFYLSDLKFENHKLNTFNFLEQLPNDSWDISLQLKDFNNDGFDDAYLTYRYISSDSIGYMTQIFLNSELGFNPTNAIELENRTDNKSDIDIIGDFNGDGFLDVLKNYSSEDNGFQFYINNGDQQFQQQIVNLSGLDDSARFRGSEDLNNDGIVDLVFKNFESVWYVIYGNTDLENLSISTLTSEVKYGSLLYFDYDGDGYKDIFIHDANAPKLLSIYKNNNGQFSLVKELNNIAQFGFVEQNNNDGIVFHTKSSRDNSMDIYRIINGNINLFKTINVNDEENFLKHDFQDLNNDGTLEFIVNYSPHYQATELIIYQLDSFGRYIEIFKDHLIHNETIGGFSFSDFDGDGLLDIFFNGKTYFSRNLPFYTGLSYDPSHSGHGFSIENVGEEQFFTVFYTYDNEGFPEWYTNLGVFENPREDYWTIRSEDLYSLVRTEYDYGNNIAIPNTNNSYKGLIRHDSCSEVYGEMNIYYEIGVNSFGIPLSKDRWCSQPIVDYYQRPQEDFSGLWWAGGDDSGWGWSISLVERDETTDLVLVLYYYDAQGNPRWLIGQKSGFVKGQEITLDMNRVKGYSRQSTPTDLTFTPTGSISLTLNEASNNLSKAGVMSIDVSYLGFEGGNWVRNNIPIALFSTPRN